MNKLNNLEQLLQFIEPNQKDFIIHRKWDTHAISKSKVNTTKPELILKVNAKKSDLILTLEQPLESIVKHWQTIYKFSGNDTEKMCIYPVGRKMSLYASILCLVYDKYTRCVSTDQKMTIINNFILQTISRMELDTKIKLFLKNLKVRTNTIIDEIKNDNYQSPLVIYYMSLILNINILVISATGLELYFGSNSYDNCKPHIMIYIDSNHTYHPIIYSSLLESQLLGYHENTIIQLLIDNCNKKIICQKNYLRLG